jgi:hypothetical protein
MSLKSRQKKEVENVRAGNRGRTMRGRCRNGADCGGRRRRRCGFVLLKARIGSRDNSRGLGSRDG